MTAMPELQSDDWMDRDSAVQRLWSRSREQPGRRADPVKRLRAIRTDGVRAAGALARQNGRQLRVIRYVQAPENEAGAHFEALELVALSRYWLVRDETCFDPAGPALLEYRPALSAARRLLRGGFADGLLVPSYEHISPNLNEYERLLQELRERGWFVALALSENGW